MRKHQTGATLIVVLILLVALTIIGTLAIRQSMVSLNVATNSQAQQLVMQNSDSAYFNIESRHNLIESFTSMGMLGYTSNPTYKDFELVFCYRGTSNNFFDINQASLINWEKGKNQPTNNMMGSDGYCRASDQSSNFFTSGRRVVMTQVSVKYPTNADRKILSNIPAGSNNLTKSDFVKIFTVSIMPNLTTADPEDIDTCLSRFMSEPTIPDGVTPDQIKLNTNNISISLGSSVTDCLAQLNVPFSSNVTEYRIEQDFE